MASRLFPIKRHPQEKEEDVRTYGLMVLGEAYRQEGTTRTPSTGVDRRNYPSNYVSDMITGQVWNIESLPDRGKVARYDPQGYNIVWGIANAVYDPWFRFVDPETGDEIMQDVQAELERLEAQKWLRLAYGYERAYGWSWLRVALVSQTDYRIDTMEHDDVDVTFMLDSFSPEDAEVVHLDKYGRPDKLRLYLPSDTGEKNSKYEEEDTTGYMLMRTRPYDRSYKGLPATGPCWDYMTYLRLIFNSIANYSQKIGLGAFIIKTKSAMTAELKASIEAMAKDLSTNRYALIDGRFIESLEFAGAQASSINFGEFIAVLMDQVAAGSMIPKDILTGASAGAISGSELNSKEAYGMVSKEQSKQNRYVRELVYRLGYTETNYLIEWNTRYATDEKEAADIEVAKVNSNIGRLQYMKLNEVRALVNLPPCDGGDESPNAQPDFSIGVKGQQPDKEEDKNNNPEGKNT